MDPAPLHWLITTSKRAVKKFQAGILLPGRVPGVAAGRGITDAGTADARRGLGFGVRKRFKNRNIL